MSELLLSDVEYFERDLVAFTQQQDAFRPDVLPEALPESLRPPPPSWGLDRVTQLREYSTSEACL